MKHLSFVSLSVINKDPNTIAAVRQALSGIDGLRYAYVGTVPMLSRDEAKEMTEDMVVYVPYNDDEPLVLVSKVGDVVGRALSADEVRDLRERSVCFGMKAKYPRTDRYGAPVYASNDEAAATYAGNFFNVAEAFSYGGEENRCDDCDEVWLSLKVQPAAVPAGHPATINYPCGSLGEEV